MKKIRAKFNNNDRVVCVTDAGKHNFYYQPYGTHDEIWLFSTKFSYSIYAYFHSKGRNINNNSYSCTVNQIYKFNDYHNKKLSMLMNRLPGQIEYAIREQYENGPDQYKTIRISDHPCIDRDDKRAA